MSSIEYIFPSSSLSDSEQNHLAGIMRDPVLLKYLKLLATEDSKELLGLGVLDMPDIMIARRHSFLSGKLAVISTLLSISQEN